MVTSNVEALRALSLLVGPSSQESELSRDDLDRMLADVRAWCREQDEIKAAGGVGR